MIFAVFFISKYDDTKLDTVFFIINRMIYSHFLTLQRKSTTDQQEISSKKKREASVAVAGKLDVSTAYPVPAAVTTNDRSTRYLKKVAPTTAIAGPGERAVAVNPTIKAVVCAVAPLQPIGAHEALARRAVGRGIRHSFGGVSQLQPTATPALAASSSVADSLSELANNYKKSLQDDTEVAVSDDDPTPLSQMQGPPDYYNSSSFSGFLSHSSSLVDLAMIAPVEDALENPSTTAREFGFDDFPNDMFPS